MLTEEMQQKRDEEYLARPDPERIFLMPKCTGLYPEERCWAEDRQDCDEPGCGCKAVEYIRLDVAKTGGFRARRK